MNKKDLVLNELEVLRSNCEYNAEAHYISAKKADKLTSYFQIYPAILSAFSSLVASTTDSSFPLFVSVASASITAISSILDPKKKFDEYKFAGHNYTKLKHEIRRVKDIYSVDMSDEDLTNKLEELTAKYNEINDTSPLTEEKSFNIARTKIQKGIHKPDNS